jgi:hypothetical protein
MTAARIAHRLMRKPTQRRDPIGFLLFYRMDWCEQHPQTTLAIVGALILLEAICEQAFQ